LSIFGKMKEWRMAFGVVLVALLVLFVGFAVYVRLASSDGFAVHVRGAAGVMEKAGPRSYMQRVLLDGRDGADVLTRLDVIARATPGTSLVAGSVAEGQVTYMTRSKLMGYPDFTTVGVHSDLIEGANAPYLELNARSRFGKSDLGVNRKRVKAWIDALQL
jgi:hypothetical protein